MLHLTLCDSNDSLIVGGTFFTDEAAFFKVK